VSAAVCPCRSAWECCCGPIAWDAPAETITELDVIDPDTELDLDELAAARAFAAEVASCCAGRDPWCGHYRFEQSFA
jgi:hypothetical protein